MALLFTLLPVLRAGDGVLEPALSEIGWFLLKLGLFVGGCTLFSLYIEPHLTHFCRRIESAPDPMLVAAGTSVGGAIVLRRLLADRREAATR